MKGNYECDENVLIGYFTHNLEDSVVGGPRAPLIKRASRRGRYSLCDGAVEKPQMQEYCHLDRSPDE